MTATSILLLSNAPGHDLAGAWWPAPAMAQVNQRIAVLTRRYVTVEHLCDRLNDLPRQFQTPPAAPLEPDSLGHRSPRAGQLPHVVHCGARADSGATC